MNKLEQDLDTLLRGVESSSALRALHFAARLISHGRASDEINVPWIAGAMGEPNRAERQLSHCIVRIVMTSVDGRPDGKREAIEALAQYALKITSARWGTGGRQDAMDYLAICRQPEFEIPDPESELRAWSSLDAVELNRLLKNLSTEEQELIQLRLKGHTWAECGDRLGHDEMWARYQWSRSLRKLRNSLVHRSR